MTKDEALDLALEALILKTGMNPVMQGSCYVMHPEALQAVIDEAIKKALAAPVQNPITEEMHIAAVKVLHRANGVDGLPQRMLDAMLAAQLAQPAPMQEPVLWLVNGVVQASDIPADYTGCLYTTPPAAQRQWVGLTEKEILECRSANHLYFYNAIEAKLKEKNA